MYMEHDLCNVCESRPEVLSVQITIVDISLATFALETGSRRATRKCLYLKNWSQYVMYGYRGYDYNRHLR